MSIHLKINCLVNIAVASITIAPTLNFAQEVTQKDIDRIENKIENLRGNIETVAQKAVALEGERKRLDQKIEALQKNSSIQYASKGWFITILIPLMTLIAGFLYFITSLYQKSVRELKEVAEKRTLELEWLQEKQKGLIDDLDQYFNFFVIHFNQVLNDQQKIDLREAKYFLDLRSGRTDLVGNAILFFRDQGRPNAIPYLEDIIAMDSKWAALAKVAIEHITNRSQKS